MNISISSNAFSIGLYLLLTINTAYITYLFYKSKNGMLRKHLIAFFSSLLWAFIVRDIMILNIAQISLYWAVVPMAFAGTALVWYLKKTYRND